MGKQENAARPWRSASIVALMACLAVATGSAAFSSTALAAEQHVFDANLSLVGTCGPPSLSSQDPAEDPSCPYPPGGGPAPFLNVCGVAVDSNGYVYVANPGKVGAGRKEGEGWIDVFDPSGEFVAQINVGEEEGGFGFPCRLAVDASGRVYAAIQASEPSKALRYTPKTFPPSPGDEAYGAAEVFGPSGGEISGVAVDRSSDHVYIARGGIFEYTPGGNLLNGVNEVAQVTVDAEGGAFKLSVYGKQNLTQTTDAISYDAPASGSGSVQERLEALSNVGPGNVLVSGGPGGAGGATPYLITFTGALANFDVRSVDEEGAPAASCDGVGLNGGGASCVSTTVAEGFDGHVAFGGDVDIWGANHDIYVSDQAAGERVVKIYDGTTHLLKKTITGVSDDNTKSPYASVAVDQATGNVFVGDFNNHRVNQFSPSGELIERVEHSPPLNGVNTVSDIAVDSTFAGESGYHSPNEGYLFATGAGILPPDHLFAFAPLEIGPPLIASERVSRVTSTSATLEGEVTPNGAPTDYHFEYAEEEDFLANGWINAVHAPLPDGEIKQDAPATLVSASITGLKASTAYRFRLVASNVCEPPLKPTELCVTEGSSRPFATYPELERTPCPNDSLRSGRAAALPDCRAYELVSPPDPGGRFLLSVWRDSFDVSLARAAGDSLMFGTEGGAVPGLDGNGYLDAYRALRVPGEGWETHSAGPSGVQSKLPEALAFSPDHGHAFWIAREYGGLLDTGIVGGTRYIRTPDGEYELVGQGSLAANPFAEAVWITRGASHVILRNFSTGDPLEPLEPNAPPKGTRAIYDRSGGVTHVVSLLPGDKTPAFGEHATYLGVSEDGSAVAFQIGATLYMRRDNAETLTIAGGGAAFEGLSVDGSRAFYREGGDIYAFDADGEGVTQITDGAEPRVINISADGSHVYFSSPKQLDGGKGEVGEENLYLWDSTTTRFIATLDPADFSGAVSLAGWSRPTGTGLVGPVSHAGSAASPTRSTDDGTVLLFESHADLAPPYEGRGHSQVYRYDAASEDLACISCNPTGTPANSDAHLQSALEENAQAAVWVTAPVANLSEDGQRAFFESDERLVLADTDGRTDVYEWKALGSGVCGRPAGCVALLSSPQSVKPDYLYAVTPDGHDVFFRSADSLLARDTDGGIPSIYDARIEGGFPPPSPPPAGCEGDGCQHSAGLPGATLGIASTKLDGPGNVRVQPSRKCRKGQHRVRRKGKARCVPRRSKRAVPHRSRGSR